MRFNTLNSRVGVVFENRFKSKLCDTDSYFLGGSRYILLNAIHAGLAKTLEDYPWSSYHEIFGQSQYQIIDQTEVSRLLGESDRSKESYREFLLEGIHMNVIEEEFGFKKDVEGPAWFVTLANKKFVRRQRNHKS